MEDCQSGGDVMSSGKVRSLRRRAKPSNVMKQERSWVKEEWPAEER